MLLKYTFETRQYNKTLPRIIIIDNSEFDIAIALFNDGGLVRRIRQLPLLSLDVTAQLEIYLFREGYDEGNLLVIFWRKRL